MAMQQQSRSVPLRDPDELEGSLLVPIATEITTERVGTDALPIARFAYPDVMTTAIQAESDTSGVAAAAAVNEEPQRVIFDEYSPPTAPLIPQYDNLQSRDEQQRRQLRLGEIMGVQKAEAEKEALSRAERNIHAVNYFAEKDVENANKIAAQRNLQGVEIECDKWFGKEETSRPDKVAGENLAFKTPTDGGYEVQEYDVGEYQTGDYMTSEYEVSEYKSVYD